MGGLIGFIGALASDDATLGAVSARTLPLVGLPLMFRYQFSSARSVLFWFDASRQAVPGVTSSSLVAEALRFSTFLAVLFGAMGIASWLAPGVVWPKRWRSPWSRHRSVRWRLSCHTAGCR
jgi:hypothetical protein